MTLAIDISNQNNSVIITNNFKSNDLKYCKFENCNKKLKLTDYPCKCEMIFCRFHRDPKQHNCQYDYKETNLQDEKILKLKCVSNKIQKLC
jgi:hypothetical protein